MQHTIKSRNIRIDYPNGSLNPTDINEQYLKDKQIIDENNKLNRGMLRIGSLGTVFNFANISRDEIQIFPTYFEIKSKNADRLKLIIDALKETYGKISPKGFLYNLDIHLIDDDYPEKIFNTYVKTEGLELDILQLKKGAFNILMYNCSRNTIHLKMISRSSTSKQFSDINIEEDLDLSSLNETYKNFLSTDLGITI